MITVILPYRTSTRRTMLRARSIVRYCPPGSHVLIAAGAIEPHEYAKLRRLTDKDDNFAVLHSADAEGFATLCNRAAKRATDPYLMFLDPTVMLHKDSPRLIRAMAEHAAKSNIGAIGGLLFRKNKRTIRQAGIFTLDGSTYHPLYSGRSIVKAMRYLGTHTFPYDPRRGRPVTAVNGYLLVGRHNFRAVSGFDTAAQSVEEAMIRFCLALNAKGRQTWYIGGGSLVEQDEQASGVTSWQLAGPSSGRQKPGDKLLPLLDEHNLPYRRVSWREVLRRMKPTRRSRPTKTIR